MRVAATRARIHLPGVAGGGKTLKLSKEHHNAFRIASDG